MPQMMLSFEGTTAPPAILDAVERGEVASFCLFGHYNPRAPGACPRRSSGSTRRAGSSWR